MNSGDNNRRFRAPWGKLLWVLSPLGGGVIATLGIGGLSISPLITVLFGSILVLCALTAVRGYRLEGDTLVIERLGFDKRISLKGLTHAQHDKTLLYWHFRMGNGGLFAFSGRFWTKRLGWFQLYGNDILGCPVLLELDGQKVVITPEYPDTFVKQVSQLIRPAR